MVESIVQTLSDLLNALQLIAIPVAAVMVVIAGYQFFRGGEEGPQKAKKLLVYLLVGLVLVFGATAIVNGVRDRIAFTILPTDIMMYFLK